MDLTRNRIRFPELNWIQIVQNLGRIRIRLNIDAHPHYRRLRSSGSVEKKSQDPNTACPRKHVHLHL